MTSAAICRDATTRKQVHEVLMDGCSMAGSNVILGVLHSLKFTLLQELFCVYVALSLHPMNRLPFIDAQVMRKSGPLKSGNW